MKILLADPPWFTFQNVNSSTVSLGLAAIAGVLEAEGHEVAIWNGDLYGVSGRSGEQVAHSLTVPPERSSHPALLQFQAVLAERRPELVGITSMTADFFSARMLAQIVREVLPDVPTVLGGVHPTLVPCEVLQDEAVDYVVAGEGEATIKELVYAVERGAAELLAGIRGLAYKREGQWLMNQPREMLPDLDCLPLPSYRGLIDKERHRPVDLSGIISSRGCPYPCTYCASHKLWTRRVRFRSIDRILQELEGLYQAGIRLFRINDDAFTVRPERVVEFCRGLRRFPGVRWSCDTRAELLDAKLLSLMRRSGCYQINIGVESGSPRIQESIKKKIDRAAFAATIALAQRKGIRVTAYFMVGFPSETPEEIEETVRLAETLKPDYPLFSTLTPYPGTEMWKTLEQAGALPKEIDYSKFYHHSRDMNYSRLSPPEFEQALENIRLRCARIERARKISFAARHPLRLLDDRRRIRPQLICRDFARSRQS